MELSLIPSPGDTRHVAYKTSQIPVLKDAVIYGPNASGKSNMIKALAFLQDFVLNNDILQDHRNDSFKFDKESVESPSILVIEIKVGKNLYQYGIVLSFKEAVVSEEWLKVIDNETLKWIEVFHSDESDELTLNSNIDSSNKERVKIYNEDNKKLKNRLLLTVLQDKALIDDILKSSVQDVYRWIKNLVILFPNMEYNLIGAVAHDIKGVNKLYREYFKMFDIDIDKIELKDIPNGMMHVPAKIAADIKNTLRGKKKGLALLHSPKEDYIMSLDNLGELKASQVVFLHKDNSLGSLLSKDEESDGTNRLMDLIPLLGNIISNNRVAIVDEINRSLHSALTHKFIQVFLDGVSKRNGSQLVFTTHDVLLLDSKIFGKKEVWFLNKKKGISSLYPLDKFKVSKMEMDNLGENYMLGRFDAIPNV